MSISYSAGRPMLILAASVLTLSFLSESSRAQDDPVVDVNGISLLGGTDTQSNSPGGPPPAMNPAPSAGGVMPYVPPTTVNPDPSAGGGTAYISPGAMNPGSSAGGPVYASPIPDFPDAQRAHQVANRLRQEINQLWNRREVARYKWTYGGQPEWARAEFWEAQRQIEEKQYVFYKGIYDHYKKNLDVIAIIRERAPDAYEAYRAEYEACRNQSLEQINRCIAQYDHYKGLTKEAQWTRLPNSSDEGVYQLR